MLTTVSGQEINVTPNHSKKTFTIRTNGLKYRTIRFNKQEFEHAYRNWTGNDWKQFLKTDEYYTVR